jgi:hypothetical protein
MANRSRTITMESLEDRTVPAQAHVGHVPLPDPTDPRVSQGHQHHVSVDVPQVGPTSGLNLGASDDLEARYVQKLYYDLLGRGLDTGAQGYIDALNNAETSRRDVADAILHSNEYLAKRVDSMFVAFLDRHADQPSIDGYVKELQDGKSLEEVAVDILSSDECRSMHSTTEDYVVSLFDLVFGRQPERSTLTEYVERLDTVGDDHDEIRELVSEIVTSKEARQMGGAAAFELMLNKTATSAAELRFVESARDGTALDVVLADLASTDEYYNLAEIK